MTQEDFAIVDDLVHVASGQKFTLFAEQAKRGLSIACTDLQKLLSEAGK